MGTKRNLGISFFFIILTVFIISFSLNYVILHLLEVEIGIMPIVLMVCVTMGVIFSESLITIRGLRREQEVLEEDLQLKEILYDLLHQTSTLEDSKRLFDLILTAAIRAIPNGDKGSIIDIRQPNRVKYVATRGFDQEVLEELKLSVSDTYLYKETHGTMNRTVIIENSIKYNKEHNNDVFIDELIKAGTEGIRSTLCTPIRVGNQVIGMINVDSSHTRAFTDNDVKTLEMFSFEVGRMIRYFEVMKENMYLSQFDSMTKVFNRGYFYELHRKLWTKRQETPYVFVATDLNNLKFVNDTYGHTCGDELIMKFADSLKAILPETCIIGRYGGDEFNILFPGFEKEEVGTLLQRVVDYLQQAPIYAKDDAITVSFSYGIVACPQEATDYEALIQKADQLMYAFKREIKNTY